MPWQVNLPGEALFRETGSAHGFCRYCTNRPFLLFKLTHVAVRDRRELRVSPRRIKHDEEWEPNSRL